MFPRIARLTVLVMALALVAVACGDDDSTPSTTAAPATTVAPQALDIVETATAAGDFTTLLAAVEAAGLVDTLKGDGPFTVFAPTDDAFATLPPGRSTLCSRRHPRLTAILPRPCRGGFGAGCRCGRPELVGHHRRRHGDRR